MLTVTQEQRELLYKFSRNLKNPKIANDQYIAYNVKRGLRNADGTGVMAGITNICNVHGYIINEGEREPIPGQLFFRGYNIKDIVHHCQGNDRFGFEEVMYLLLFGELPDSDTLKDFCNMIRSLRHLPEGFAEDMIIKAPSPNIMNKMARSVLALYSYDDEMENATIEKELEIAVNLIAKMSVIMVDAYQVKRRHYDGETMFFHPLRDNESFAESILSMLRPDRKYTHEEAMLLDLCLILHAEHGGGNNSTFASRVLTSSGTDAYSAIAAGIGALKGPKHGGANIKVMEMVSYFKRDVEDITDPEQVKAYLEKILDKKGGDGSGLIYGMGHAVYTISDPRAELLKEAARNAVAGTELEDTFRLLELVQELTPEIYARKRNNTKPMCANVDLYSGLVYYSLNIPVDLYTPLFAVARMCGWAAHRMEEIMTGSRIMRPAYKSIAKPRPYIPLEDR